MMKNLGGFCLAKIMSVQMKKNKMRSNREKITLKDKSSSSLDNYAGASLKLKSYLAVRGRIFDFGRLLKFVPKNPKKIVDIGCGYGILDFMLAENFKRTKILASDLNKKRIDYLKKTNRYKNLSFECRDAVKSKTDADVIICVDLLHHISYAEQQKLLEKIHKNAPDNVTLIIKDMDKGYFSFRQLVNFSIDIISAKQYPLFYHTKNSFIELFEKNSFAVQKVEHLNKLSVPLNHIVFVLKKSENKQYIKANAKLARASK
jgi:2-polyprenyl-3-methyl-5-hydroxy-6-metoxy-1,4-benzoquinol methylase